MKISRHDKLLLFEMEFLALFIIIILGLAFYWLRSRPMFYLITLLIGFVLYFWMLYEEKVYHTSNKHDYFEHTSSYVMLGQTALVLSMLFAYLGILLFLVIILLVISVIMYSVSLSRIILYKAVFRQSSP